MSDGDGTAEPHHGFDDSRRLTGPNRWFAGTAVQLTPLGAQAREPAAHARWARHVREMAAALGWPDPAPRAALHASEATLAFAAPAHLLFTATEVNEWAWERASAGGGFDLAQDHGDAAAAVFAARAAAEDRPALRALRAAAATLPVLVDDDSVSVGSGTGSSAAWPLDALPDTLPQALHAVPTALVTGSNGKTTTVRLIAAMAAEAGLVPGWCCTEGVFVGGQALQAGDWSGPAGARAVLRDRRVQLAVLETARGGILRRGLAVDRAEVAVVTNVSPDHLGEYGVDSAAELAAVKLVVAHAVAHGGTLVLNADDALLVAAAAALPARRALFSTGRKDADCAVHDGRLVLRHDGARHDLGPVADMPLTLQGSAAHNVANIAAAALAAAALGLPMGAIERTLRRFGSSPLDNPGRLERWQHRGATVLLDYAHNPEGLATLLQVARSLQPRRLGLLLGQAGNRGDDAIVALACTAAAAAPDHVVVKELPLMLRGRAPGAVPALLTATLRAGGVAAERIEFVADETAAALRLLAWAAPGDVVVLPVHTGAVRGALHAVLHHPP